MPSAVGNSRAIAKGSSHSDLILAGSGDNTLCYVDLRMTSAVAGVVSWMSGFFWLEGDPQGGGYLTKLEASIHTSPKHSSKNKSKL